MNSAFQLKYSMVRRGAVVGGHLDAVEQTNSARLLISLVNAAPTCGGRWDGHFIVSRSLVDRGRICGKMNFYDSRARLTNALSLVLATTLVAFLFAVVSDCKSVSAPIARRKNSAACDAI